MPFSHTCSLKHSSRDTPCRQGKNCKYFPKCAFYHSPENTPNCKFGDKCKRRDTCPFIHPDQVGFVPDFKEPSPSKQVNLNPCPVKDNLGYDLIYDENGTAIGLIDNGRIVSFIDDIPDSVQEADYAWDKEVDGFMSEYLEDEEDKDKGWVTDPEAYPDHSETNDNENVFEEDEWDTDPEAYPDHSKTKACESDCEEEEEDE